MASANFARLPRLTPLSNSFSFSVTTSGSPATAGRMFLWMLPSMSLSFSISRSSASSPRAVRISWKSWVCSCWSFRSDSSRFSELFLCTCWSSAGDFWQLHNDDVVEYGLDNAVDIGWTKRNLSLHTSRWFLDCKLAVLRGRVLASRWLQHVLLHWLGCEQLWVQVSLTFI